MTPEIENEQLRTRLAEMAAEVERLQSVIDAANAQEPDGFLSVVPLDGLHKHSTILARPLSPVLDGQRFYFRPIPAQQCTHERIRETQTGDGVLFNGSHGHAGYVIEEQQSPAVAVAVPDFETWWRNLPSYRDADKPAAKMAWDYLAGQISGFQSPRITEQDDIATIEQLVNDLYSEIEARFTPETLKYESMKRKYDNDMHTVNRGLALLDKLNGVKNAQ